MNNITTLECLLCGEPIVIKGDHAVLVSCPACGKGYEIDYDGEQRDGIWYNLTKLIEIPHIS